MNAIPVSVSLGFGLVMVKVSSDFPFARIGSVPNALAIVGGTMAVSDAVAEPPLLELVPPSVVEMNPLTFV